MNARISLIGLLFCLLGIAIGFPSGMLYNERPPQQVTVSAIIIEEELLDRLDAVEETVRDMILAELADRLRNPEDE